MMLGNIKFVSADTEINRIMNNKNQDVLFVGSVTYVSDNYFVLSAKDYQHQKQLQKERKIIDMSS